MTPSNYLRLSAAYRSLNQLDKAEQQVLLAKQHAPGNLEVIYNEAQIYQEEGRSTTRFACCPTRCRHARARRK